MPTPLVDPPYRGTAITTLAIPPPTLSDSVAGTLPDRSLTERVAVVGALEPATAERLLRDIGSALVELHRAGGVHGDVGPETIWLDGQDRGRLVSNAAGAPDATAADD